MATSKTRSVAPVEAPVVEAAPAAAAPVKPSGFNLPRVVAKAPKPVEDKPEKVVYAAGDSVTLSGVARSVATPVEKQQIVVRPLRDIGR
jgi:hypothetical protein